MPELLLTVPSMIKPSVPLLVISKSVPLDVILPLEVTEIPPDLVFVIVVTPVSLVIFPPTSMPVVPLVVFSVIVKFPSFVKVPLIIIPVSAS